MNKNDILILDKLLHEYHENIRGEVLVSELGEKGFPTNDIDVEYVGSFLRPFRTDIMGGKATEVHKDYFRYTLELSRNGIYDVLPEGISHKQEVLKDNHKSVGYFSGLYKKRKKEEQEARDFFKPIENEFFNTRVEFEKTEKDLFCLNQNHFFNFLATFWRIDTNLPVNLQEQLLHILPFAHKIAGDFELISKILSISLKTNVSFQIKYQKEEVATAYNILGKGYIGEDCIIGNKTAPNPIVEFNVGEIPADKTINYINNGKYARFTEVLFEYLIPIEFDAKINLKCSKHEMMEAREEIANYGYIGYTV